MNVIAKRDFSVDGVFHKKGEKFYLRTPNNSLSAGITDLYTRNVLFNCNFKDLHTLFEGFYPYEGDDELSPLRLPTRYSSGWREYTDLYNLPAWKHVKGSEYVFCDPI